MSLSNPSWQFAEMDPVGIDFASNTSAQSYEARQRTFSGNDDALLDRLGVTEGSRLLDLGCGTGSLLVRAALRGAQSHGADVSSAMLGIARQKAQEAGVSLDLQQRGFLTYEFSEDQKFDFITTKACLHQLPDFWKQVALQRIRGSLREGGLLYIWDIVYSFPHRQYRSEIQHWIDVAANPQGQGYTQSDYETHVREEFSTFAWILEGMIERAKLSIIEKSYPMSVHAEYVCRAI